MKKRLRKKLEKRVGCMHYNDARRELLVRAIKHLHPDAEMIIITTSKRGGAILNIETCSGVVPTAMSMGGSSNE